MDQNLPFTWKTSTRSHGPLSIEQTQFEILPDEFTEANGMLTPSLKTRRAQIVEHYRELIDNVIYVPLKK